MAGREEVSTALMIWLGLAAALGWLWAILAMWCALTYRGLFLEAQALFLEAQALTEKSIACLKKLEDQVRALRIR